MEDRHREHRGLQLQQTLLQTTTLILVGLAVAFAFRCGLFNIGGNGQYLVGLICANWIGVSFAEHGPPGTHPARDHGGGAAGAVWAGIAGFLKATVGAHEVITTIMLNWIAYWFGSYVFGQGGPLQDAGEQTARSRSPPTSPRARATRSSGATRSCRACTSASSSRIGVLVVFWLVLSRTTLGYEVRAVGYNPDAAAYGGISVAHELHPGDGDLRRASPGWPAGSTCSATCTTSATIDVQASTIGFLGIAVALLGRNTAVGVGLGGAALRRPRLRHDARPPVRTDRPSSPVNLTEMIQGLVVLFVGADVSILAVWNARRRAAAAERVPKRRGDLVSALAGGVDRVLRSRRSTRPRSASFGILLGVIAFLLAIPPITSREA